MGDLTNSKLIYAKGFLFVLTGTLAASLLLIDSPTLKTAALLAIAVWSFCRAYYFVFYVIEHYVDPTFRFAGLLAFAQYLLRSRKR
jgi:hypothetical protein